MNRLALYTIAIGLILTCGCNTESEQLTSKDILSNYLVSNIWSIQLINNTKEEKYSSGEYYAQFNIDQTLCVNNCINQTGNWDLYYKSSLEHYDELSISPDDNSEPLIWDDTYEDHLILILNFETKINEDLQNHWIVTSYNSKSVSLINRHIKLILSLNSTIE
nr:hypothetical protein [uncultured Carboxylicivirga sp.]